MPKAEFAASWGAWLKAAGLNEDTPTAQLEDSDSGPAWPIFRGMFRKPAPIAPTTMPASSDLPRTSSGKRLDVILLFEDGSFQVCDADSWQQIVVSVADEKLMRIQATFISVGQFIMTASGIQRVAKIGQLTGI
jgi:hypothetical protein